MSGRGPFITYFVTAFLVTFVFMTNPESIGFNSDAVYLPALFTDIFVRGYHFSSWYLTPAPYFFPDMLVFFIIEAMVHNVFYVFLIYAIIQNIVILYLISKIAFLVTQNKTSVFITHIIFLFALVCIYPSTIPVYHVFLKSAHHVGTLINGLLLIYSLILYSKCAKNSILLAVFIVSILGASSDLLFVIQFVLPIIGSLFLCKFLKIKVIESIAKFLFILILGCVIGYSLRHSIGAPTHFNYVLTHPAFSNLEIYQKISFKLKEVFSVNPSMGVFILLFYLILIIQCVIRMFFRKQISLISVQKRWRFFFILFVLISVMITSESMSINGILSDRYLLNIFWFPVFFFWILYERKFNQKMFIIALYLISIIAISCKLLQNHSYALTYTPEIVRCVDKQIHEYNLTHKNKIKYGISTYWQAKIMTVFSKEGIIISQYTYNLSPRLWITSAENYRSTYDFVILSKRDLLDMNLIEQINGKPSLIFSCDSDLSLWIYGESQLRVTKDEIK